MSLLFPHLTPGHVRSFRLERGGTTLACEAILTDSWTPDMAAGPSSGADIRLVVLSRWQRVPRSVLASPRVAVVVPGAPAAAGLVREAQAHYDVGEASATEQERASYVNGLLLTRRNLPLTCAQAFAAPDGQRALERIAWVMAERVLFSAWQKALLYARALAPEMAAVSPEEAERLLARVLPRMTQRVHAARLALERLARGMGHPVPPALRESLRRLRDLSRSKDSARFISRARVQGAAGHSPEVVAADVAVLERVEQAGAFAEEAIAIRRYLSGAAPGAEEELDVDRLSIMEQLTLDNLVANPHVWPSVRSLFDWFRSRYQAAYRERHRVHHRRLAALKRRLDDEERKADALTRLNTLRELGPPLGCGALRSYGVLRREVQPCPDASGRGKPDLESTPVCPSCGMTLVSEPPDERVESVIQRVDEALAAQHRRLSAQAIRRILARGRGRRLEKFLQVVQASDMAALADVLDDTLVDFLRKLLQEARAETPLGGVLEQLARRFPVVEEARVPDVVSAFNNLLRDALRETKKGRPGARARIVLREG